MSKVVSMKREKYIGTGHDYDYAVAKRKQLMWTRPIVDDEITLIDQWLMDNPHVTLHDCANAMSRAVFIQHLLYADADTGPVLRQRMLLSLRRQYRDFQKLPESARKGLSWIWNCWAELLEEEEVNGAA